jgi:hypothetical protein
MLPPFVPPSVRAATETLPLITEFVINRTERSLEPQSSQEAFLTAPVILGAPRIVPPDVAATMAPETPVVATPVHEPPVLEQLPSIDEFLWTEPKEAEQGSPAELEPLLEQVMEQQPAADVVPEPAVVATAPIAEPEPTGWVDEERNAFDWQSVAQLAPAVDEERRAAEEWQRTEWDSPATTGAEHVASVLVQVARLVRSGELRVDASRGMSTEAALAAVLAALLSDPDGSDSVRRPSSR